MKITKQMEAELAQIADGFFDGKEIIVGDFCFKPDEDWDFLRDMREIPPGDDDFVVHWKVELAIPVGDSDHRLRLCSGSFKVFVEYKDYKPALVEVCYDNEWLYPADTADVASVRWGIRNFIEHFNYDVFRGRVSP